MPGSVLGVQGWIGCQLCPSQVLTPAAQNLITSLKEPAVSERRDPEVLTCKVKVICGQGEEATWRQGSRERADALWEAGGQTEEAEATRVWIPRHEAARVLPPLSPASLSAKIQQTRQKGRSCHDISGVTTPSLLDLNGALSAAVIKHSWCL